MGYYRHKYLLSMALDDLSERGLPVDRARQSALRNHIETDETTLLADLQALVPEEVRPSNRKDGYKNLPKDLRAALKLAGLVVPKAKLDYYYTHHYDLCNELGYFIRSLDGEFGLVKVLDFNPNSSQQLLHYIEHRGYPIPRHIDTGKPTTGQAEIEKLVEQTNDPLLKLVQKLRKLTKLGGTYCNGDWVPGEDGRVHTSFKVSSTASGQTAATNPNIQQFPEHFNPEDEWIADIVHRVKDCIRAEPGHKLVKVDARGAHGRMQGFLAEDAPYYRLANLDLHSYNTAHYLRLPDRYQLLDLDDVALSRRLKEIKRAHEHDRNFKLKRVAYLMQFMGGAEKAYKILTAFDSVIEVQQLMDMIKTLFPKAFKDFPASVEQRMKQYPRLISPSGGCRWFWDYDLQQAVAFSVSNPFHCHVQDALIRLWERGALLKYEGVNFTHDAVWMHPRVELVDEAIAVAKEEFERPSEILVNSLGAFQCMSDAQVGDVLSEMEDYL